MTTTQSPAGRSGGALLLAGALLTIAASVTVGVAAGNTTVPDDLFRYPFSHDGAVRFAALAAITHLLIGLGVLGMWRSGVIGTGRAARRSATTVLAGTAMLFVCEWVSIPLFTHSTHYGWSQIADAGFGVASLAVTFGMIAVGIVALREGTLQAWRRYAPLTCGLLSLTVIPLQFTTAIWLGVAIYGFGYALLGVALVTDPAAARFGVAHGGVSNA
jgi:hypothetical protein